MTDAAHSDQFSASERVMQYIDEYCATDENRKPKYTDADLEAVVDAPAGDPEISPAQRIAANWLLKASCSKGTDAIKAIEKLLSRQLGSPHQSSSVDTRTTYRKEVSWDRPDEERSRWDDPGFRSLAHSA